MANTQIIKTHIEPYVRSWLSEKYRFVFRKDFLPLIGCQGVHEFDAVSSDNRIVGSIKSSSAKTSGGNSPSGKFSAVFEELYFLSNIDANVRLMILTDSSFFDLVCKKTKGKLARGIEILYCPLSSDLEARVRTVQQDASAEIDRGKTTTRH